MPGPIETVKLAIAGCGALTASIHLPNLIRMRGVRVTALSDPDPAALAAAARFVPDARTTTDWTGLIGGADVDAVLVALPARLNASAARAVLESGRHLYVEKPIATTLEDAGLVLAAARAAGAVATVGFNYRFNPLFVQLRDVVRDSELGRLIAVRSCFSSHGRTGGWRADGDAARGVLLDLASHHADLIPYVTGHRVTAAAATIPDGSREGDTVAVTFELENGVLAQSLFSRVGPEQDTIELIGELGTATVRRYESLTVERRGRDAAGARRDQLRNLLRGARAAGYLRRKAASPGSEPSYRIALERFIDRIRAGQPSSPGIEDGYDALAIVDAAATAVATGRPVRVQRAPAHDTTSSHAN